MASSSFTRTPSLISVPISSARQRPKIHSPASSSPPSSQSVMKEPSLVPRKLLHVEANLLQKKVDLIELEFRFNKFVSCQLVGLPPEQTDESGLDHQTFESILAGEDEFKFFDNLKSGELWDRVNKTVNLSEQDEEIILAQAQKEFSAELEALTDSTRYFEYFFDPNVMWKFKRRHCILAADQYPSLIREILEPKRPKFIKRIKEKPLPVRLMLTPLPEDEIISTFMATRVPGSINYRRMQCEFNSNPNEIAKHLPRPEYRMDNPAIVIYNYVFDWNPSGLLIPRWIFLENPHSLQIPISDTAYLNHSDLFGLSKKLTEWNNQWKYNDSGSISNKIANSQDFVNRILKHLEIEPDWEPEGYMDIFLKKCKDNLVGNELKLWDLQGNPLVFGSHDHLGMFWRANRFKHPKQPPPNFNIVMSRNLELEALVRTMERIFSLRGQIVEDSLFEDYGIFGARPFA